MEKQRNRSYRLTCFGFIVGAFVFFVLLTVLSLSPADASPCGGAGQRACCVGENINGACPGLTEVNGCDGDCQCSNLPLSSSNSHCIAATPCGGEGQRACCGGELTNGPCQSGLTEVNGCAGGDCTCGGSANPFGVSSNSSCIRATACGGDGQRACCGGELINGVSACQSGLQELPFSCSGDCLCGGTANPFQISSSGICGPSSVSLNIAEPSTNWEGDSALHACELTGYADMHAHMFAELAHGGKVLAGKAYDPNGGGIAAALSPSADETLHGLHGLIGDPIGAGTQDGSVNKFGPPYFADWPTWTSTTHQQMYYPWLERAYRGGLRLMVLFAVTNEALCKSRHGTDCENSMLPPSRLADLDQFDERFRPLTATPPSLPPIEAQLQLAYQFEDFINAQAGSDDSKKWFKIVKTPAEARAAITAGKLAVVLGIEVDNPFGCRYDTQPCTQQTVSDAVDKYYAKGVRHIFPIHNFTNQFGSPAAWQDAINVGNRAATGTWWGVEDCSSQGYGFWLDSFVQFWINLFGFSGFEAPDYSATQGKASCNANGLTNLGSSLLTKLKQKGMIIDIDHMSNKAFNDTLTWAEANNYPVVASHVLFFDLHNQNYGGNAGRHERLRTSDQLTRIKNVGGMITVMLKDDVQDTSNKGKKETVTYSGTNIADNCMHSTKTLAQAYQYAVDKMGGPVAFGSDFNGVAGHIGPRFGTDACGGDGAEDQDLNHLRQLREGNKLQYPFSLQPFGHFDKQVTGKKTFDFNVDGLAHVGLLPDMVADLQNVGLSSTYTNQLFKSAEGYIKVWEKADPTSSSGSSTTAVCVNPTVNADNTCKATASVATAALLNDSTVTLSQSPAGPYSEGPTSVTLTVTPKASCALPTTCTGTVTVVDKTAPSITCPANVTTECTGSSSAKATFADATLGTDNCPGIVTSKGCSPISGSSFALGSNTVTCSDSDDASPANVGSCNFTVKVVDTTPPSITCPASATVECTGSQTAFSPTAATASDTCTGVTITNPPAGTFPFGTTTLNYSAKDAANLTASCTSTVKVVDTTKPTITCPAPKTIECTGNRSASFTPVAATASDTCAGVTVSNPPTATFPLGSTTLNYSVTDAVGLGASCTSSVTVADTTKPTITSLSASPASLWPPNHKMAAVTVSATATDACNSSAPVCQITGISSNEPVNGLGDGDTAPDWQITGPLTANLRAERSGTGTGRIYTVQVTCTDQQGLSTVGSTTVTVPHDQGH